MSQSHTSHSTTRTLKIALLLGIGVLVAEIIGGIKSGSLALLSDAGHEFSDLLSLGITLFAIRIATRPATAKHTFGYHRAEVLGALVNGIFLLVMAAIIGVEAWQRLFVPHEIKGGLASIFGFVGLVPNIWTALRLRESTNINIRSAFFHALGDAASSLVVVASGILIALTGLTQFDGLASFLVVALLVIGAVSLLKHVFIILFEGVPENLNREKVSKIIAALPGVEGTHDVHLWTLCSDVVYLTGHIVINGHPNLQKAQATVAHATRALDHAGVHHATLQVETPDHSCVKQEACEIVH